MGIPLRPALILAGGLISGGTGAKLIADAASKTGDAEDRYTARRARYDEARDSYGRRRSKGEAAFERLGKRRLQAVVTLGRAVDFLKKARVKDRDFFGQVNVTQEELRMWESASVDAGEILVGAGKGAAAGVFAAAAGFKLVGKHARAGSGRAIRELGGINAQRAALAWLGGGPLRAGGGGIKLGQKALAGGAVGPAVLVYGLIARSRAEKVLTEVESHIADMDTAEAEMSLQLALLETAMSRVDELYTATGEVDGALADLLGRASIDRTEDVYAVVKTAKALADLLDVALLDENGNLKTS